MIWSNELLKQKHAIYTDVEYLDKEQLRKKLNTTANIDPLWQTVIQYRRTFRHEFILKTPTYQNLGIHLTPKIAADILQLEKKLTANISNESLKADFKNNINNEIINLAKGYGFDVNEEDIAKATTSDATDSKTSFLKATTECFSVFNKNFTFTKDTVEFWKTTFIKYLFKNPSDLNRNIVLKNKAGDSIGFSIKEMPERYADFLKLFQDSWSSNFVKANIALFYFLNGMFFSKYNEAFAVLMFYGFMFEEYKEIALTAEIVSSTTNKQDRFGQVIIRVQQYSDINYLLLFIKDLYLSKLSTAITEKKPKRTTSKNDFSGIKGKYPELSNMQASFISKCNDADTHYTLNDFMNLNSSSYETSRYSLDKLVQLGFYTKIKVGKKFVYKTLKKI